MENISNLPKEITEKFIQELRDEDRRESERVKAQGCPLCGGNLNVANYPRKPRGLGSSDPEMSIRESFCCARCRRRVTPKSVRFLGRKVYSAVSLVAAEVLSLGNVSKSKVCWVIGMKSVTLLRWRKWWNVPVKRSQWWKGIKGMFIPPLSSVHYIGDIFHRICSQFQLSQSPQPLPPQPPQPHSVSDGLKKVLSIISPLTIPAEYSLLFSGLGNCTQKMSTANSSKPI